MLKGVKITHLEKSEKCIDFTANWNRKYFYITNTNNVKIDSSMFLSCKLTGNKVTCGINENIVNLYKILGLILFLLILISGTVAFRSDKFKSESKLSKIFITLIVFYILIEILLLITGFVEFLNYKYNIPEVIGIGILIIPFILFGIFAYIADKRFVKSKYKKEIKTSNLLIIFAPMVSVLVAVPLMIALSNILEKIPFYIALPAYLIVGASVGFLIGGFFAYRALKPYKIDNEQYYNIVSEICEKKKMNFDEILVIDSPINVANAMVVQLLNKKILIVTKQLVDLLDREELESILAHEYAHSKRNHIIKISIFTIALLYIILVIIYYLASISNIKINPYSNLFYTLYIISIVLIILLSILLERLFSRRFEKKADLEASRISDPKTLIKALVKIYKFNKKPKKDSLLSRIFRTHPSLEKRVLSVAKQWKIPEEEVKKILKELEEQPEN